MSERRTIAVSQRIDDHPERDERRDALDQRLAQWLIAAGRLPVPVPNGLGAQAVVIRWLEALGVGGIVLSGGGEIGQAPERDATERALLAYARDRGLPVLGICRGMQMMAVEAGASLKPVSGHVRTRHALRGAIRETVNSYHGNALAMCPSGYEVLAVSEDGEIEAIGNPTTGWEGWMWHPERDVPFAPWSLSRAGAVLRIGPSP